MNAIREPIGEIECPLCGRLAELHSSDARTKVAAEPDGRAAYPRKLYVVCPPVLGYRGCGTLLCNNKHAQQRLLDRGRVFGPDGKPAPTTDAVAAPPVAPEPAVRSAPAIAPETPPAKPASPTRGLFNRFS